METLTPKIGNRLHILSDSEIVQNQAMLDKWMTEGGSRVGDTNPGIAKKQQHAADKFIAEGLPGRKWEDYKYTHLNRYINADYSAKSSDFKINPDEFESFLHDDFVSLIVINGKYLPEYSRLKNLPKEITIKTLGASIEEGNETAIKHFNASLEKSRNPFAILNTALSGNGVFISVPEKFSCPVPIHIVNICSDFSSVETASMPSFHNARNLVFLNKQAELTLLETYHSSIDNKKKFSNSVTEFFIEEAARMENYVLQDENSSSTRNDVHQFVVNHNSYLNNVVISTNGGMIRNDPTVLIEGENAEVHLNGLFLVKENLHIDNHTMVEHRVPNCFSNELYKGIISDNGKGVFNGKILVYHDAQKTNAYQSNKNILLGDKAEINTKPQLEIYADDVKCTHGTSTGMLNEEALFYLESRGLNKKLAKNVLLHAFAKEVSNTIKNEAFRTFIEQKIEENIQ